MKKLLLFGFFLTSCMLGAVPAPDGWTTDIGEARSRAQKENRPVLVLFSGTDWCPPCKELRKNLLDTRDFRKLLDEKAVALYVHVPRRADDGFRKTMADFSFVRLQSVPTILVTDPGITRVLQTVEVRSLQGFSRALDAAAKKLP